MENDPSVNTNEKAARKGITLDKVLDSFHSIKLLTIILPQIIGVLEDVAEYEEKIQTNILKLWIE